MRVTSPAVIGLLTDFGTAGWYAACLKGVILSRCPRPVQLIDITHEIPPQDVVAGALTLAAAAPWFPKGAVFACVVDPGVGTRRPLLAAEADGRRFVGPDNGLLDMVLRGAKRVRIVRLTNRRFWLPKISTTFHGRDIIAPVVAHLAGGGSLRPLGAAVTRYERLRLPIPQRQAASVRGCILLSDPFGNVLTNIPAKMLPRAGSFQVRYRRQRVRVVCSYAEARPRELVALIGSAGMLELAVREGSAARRLRARRGDAVEVVAPSRKSLRNL